MGDGKGKDRHRFGPLRPPPPEIRLLSPEPRRHTHEPSLRRRGECKELHRPTPRALSTAQPPLCILPSGAVPRVRAIDWGVEVGAAVDGEGKGARSVWRERGQC